MTEENRAKPSKAMDFDFLRKEGTRLLQKMSGTEWTDYNLHDPGVTILEYLCFAITDLAYRTNFDIEDLLTQEDGTINYARNSFIKPAQALSSNAVTLLDFRKILIDEIHKIENIWIDPLTSQFSSDSIKGLYKFYVQVNLDNLKLLSDDKQMAGLKREVQEFFVANRNLCEDACAEVHILQPQDIIVKAKIIIGQDILPENVMAQVYYTIETFLNPAVRFYTEKDLLNKNYTLDEIYSGPLLKGGFIPDEELGSRKLNVDPLKLTQFISLIEGVIAVDGLTINGFSIQPVAIDAMHFPYFNIIQSRKEIQISKDGLELQVKQSLLNDVLQNLREKADKRYIHNFNKIHPKDIHGSYKDSSYHSIQRVFPAIYGIGEEGLSGTEDAIRLANAKQLKAYLVFFEQIMANYLANLGGIDSLFSNKIDLKHSSSYYSQTVNSVPLFSEIVFDTPGRNEGNWKEYFDDLSASTYSDFLQKGSERKADYFERKNNMLDHLLARFNESLVTYPVQEFDKLYGKNHKSEVIEKELRWKSNMLQDINQLSHARSLGFNYFVQGKSASSYDFRRKMYHLLYINNHPGNSLVYVFGKRLEVKASKYKPDTPDLITEKHLIKDELLPDPGMRKIVTLSQEEYKKIIENDSIVPYPEEISNGEAVFQNQPVSFLKHALDIDNYRLAHDLNDDHCYLLLYREPGSKAWYTVNKHGSYTEATAALDDLIDLLIKTSTSSEGFYLVEHLLLRPRITSKEFGFRFYNEKGSLVLESTSWNSFAERELQIANLIKLASEKSSHTEDQFTKILLENHWIPQVKSTHLPYFSADDYNKITELIDSLKSYSQNQKNQLSRFEMTIRLAEKTITEDYFSFRMSIILPEWPARFQDESFQNFIKDLFHIQSPAHLRLNFYWLNKNQMTVFEEMYASWLDELRLNDDKNERLAASNLSYFIETLQSDDR